MPEYTPEFRLLLASALHPLQDLEIERLQTCCHPSIDWETFESLVQRHRLIPTVYHNLSRYAASSVPEPVLVRLKDYASRNRQRILQLLAELSHISQWFTQAGIQACALKGPLLAQRLYGDVSLRTSRDIDLLIRPASLIQADELLLAHGCQRTFPAASLTPRQWQVFQQEWYHNVYFLPERQIYLEIHWAIAPPYLVAPEIVNQLFSRACPAALSGSDLNTLADEDLPVYLLVHGTKDNWVRLKWLVDFATWMRQTADQDWGMIRWKMEEIGLGRSLLQGVLLAHWLFSVPIPEPLQALVRDAPNSRKLAEHSANAILDASYTGMEGGNFRRLRNSLYLMKLKDGLRYQWVVLSKILVIPHDWQDMPLPDALFPLYFLLRPFLWLRRYHLRPRRSQSASNSIEAP